MLTTHDIQNLVDTALSEDIGTGDITAALIPEGSISRAEIWAKVPAVLCGRAFAEATFKTLDPRITLTWHVEEGHWVDANTCLLTLEGPSRALLTGERTALNFLQTLSAMATHTAQLTQRIGHTPCKLLDTRKTIPGLRLASKYATQVGGAVNHRIGLYDAFLIKENHIEACGSITQAIETARRQQPDRFVEIEVETLAEFKEAVAARPDRIMLDNFTPEALKTAISQPHHGIPLEASGNITQANLVDYAETGVDYISLGTLTKDIQAIDLSMRLKSTKT